MAPAAQRRWRSASDHPGRLLFGQPRETSQLARPLVLVVLALAGSRPELRPKGRTRVVQFRVHVQSGLIDPTLQQHQPVGVRHALEDLELLAAGLLGRLRAAGLLRLGQLGALSQSGADRHDKPYRHDGSSLQAAQKGPDARLRPTAAREAYSLCIERAAYGAPLPLLYDADGPFFSGLAL